MVEDSIHVIKDSFYDENLLIEESEMELYRLPVQLQADANSDYCLKTFKQEFDVYLVPSEKNKDLQNGNILNTEENNYSNILNDFEICCAPPKNLVNERFKFNQRCQENGEGFDQFLSSIRKLIRTCKYGKEEENVLRDRIVMGISSLSLQEKLLGRKDDFDSKTAIKLCRSAEMAKSQAR